MIRKLSGKTKFPLGLCTHSGTRRSFSYQLMEKPSKIRSEVGVCPPCTQGPVSSAPGLTLGAPGPSWMERWRGQSSLCCFHGIFPVSVAIIYGSQSFTPLEVPQNLPPV